MKNNTPQQFALQLGSLIALYLSLSFLLTLLFGLITLLFPDASEQYYVIESASSAVRLGIAMVIVFFPTYLILTRIVNRIRRKEHTDQYLTLTKWLIYLSLLAGVLTMLVDLVIVLNYFLEGDITARFIYKAVSVLIVIGSAVSYYILDARGYWVRNEQKSKLYAGGAIIVVLCAVVFGFTHIATPTEVRAQKLDAKEINDLQLIQSKVQEYYSLSSSTLPTTLEEAYGVFPVPTAPEDRPAYTYERTDRGFKLCATFAKDLPTDQSFSALPLDKARPIINENDWQYKAGNFCFERILNK
jgi:uncharacterized membrane protein YdcZ (DUF606 family)